MNFIPTLTLITNISLILTFIFGLYFGWQQVKASNRDRKERLTLEALRNFQTREFAELLQFVISPEFPKTREEIKLMSQENNVKYIQFAQQMESLGILVSEDLIDLELVEKTLGSFTISSWKKYSVIFTKMRDNDPYIGEYFEWLAERMEERMKKNPRKPVYLIK